MQVIIIKLWYEDDNGVYLVRAPIKALLVHRVEDNLVINKRNISHIFSIIRTVTTINLHTIIL